MKSFDLGKDKPFGLVLRLAIPAMLGQLVNVLYGIVDRIFIGQIDNIGSLALAGVGVYISPYIFEQIDKYVFSFIGSIVGALFMIVLLHGRLKRFSAFSPRRKSGESAYRGLPGGVPRDGYCTGILTE